MIVGVREKNKLEIIQEHLVETNENITGWNNEKEFAIKRNNEDYKQFCNNMSQIWENTKKELEQELKKYR